MVPSRLSNEHINVLSLTTYPDVQSQARRDLYILYTNKLSIHIDTQSLRDAVKIHGLDVHKLLLYFVDWEVITALKYNRFTGVELGIDLDKYSHINNFSAHFDVYPSIGEWFADPVLLMELSKYGREHHDENRDANAKLHEEAKTNLTMEPQNMDKDSAIWALFYEYQCHCIDVFIRHVTKYIRNYPPLPG